MTSRKRPVPAAQRSFISKSANAPAPLPRRMTLESWPPMSMTRPASGLRKRAPSAQAVISVTTRQSRWAFIEKTAVSGRHRPDVVPLPRDAPGRVRGRRSVSKISKRFDRAGAKLDDLGRPRTQVEAEEAVRTGHGALFRRPNPSRNASMRVRSWPVSSSA